MRTRSWRKWWVAGTILLLLAQGAIAASPLQDFEARALQSIARHADREAAMALVDAWQQRARGGLSPASVALNEGLSGHYLTAKQLMARVVAEHPEDASARLGSLVLVLLEGNPPTCRQAIEDVAAVYPENPQLQQRYSDVLESMGLASAPLPTPPEPTEAPASESEAPVSVPVAATPVPTAPEPREIRPVQAESVREQLLRQLAESQARQAKEEALRLQRVKDEQARKRREEAARLAAEKQRREDAARQAAEQQRLQEQARLAAEREKARLAEEKRQQQVAAQQSAAQRAAEQKAAEQQKAMQARQVEQQKAAERSKQAEQARLAAEQQKADQAKRANEQVAARQSAEQHQRLEKAEQERWVAARRQQSPAPPVRPPDPPSPTPSAAEGPSYVLKPIKIANRRVWVGEDRASVHARLGRPKSVEGADLERYAGLSIWYDSRGKVSTFELDSAWYYGPGGVRPGLTLKEVLRALPNSDGLFHLRSTEPDATSSLYVLSTVDGTIAELQFNDEGWLSTMVRTTTPAGATHLYEELLQKGPVRRLAPDYVFALEARRRPLP